MFWFGLSDHGVGPKALRGFQGRMRWCDNCTGPWASYRYQFHIIIIVRAGIESFTLLISFYLIFLTQDFAKSLRTDRNESKMTACPTNI